MNQEQRTQIGELWLTIAAMYGKEIQRPALKLLLDSVNDLPFKKIIDCLTEWPKTCKVARYPYPADVREFIYPQLNSRELAVSIARNIDKAISKYGYTWSMGYMFEGEIWFNGGGYRHKSFKEAVIAELGEIAWHAICSRGSWEKLRNSANEMDEGTFIAQMREQIESTINLQKNGIDITKIELPNSQNKNLDYNENVSNLVDYKKIT